MSTAPRTTRATPMPTLLSIEEAARILGVSGKTVRRYVRDGELKVYNIGAVHHPTWRIADGEIRRFLASREQS